MILLQLRSVTIILYFDEFGLFFLFSLFGFVYVCFFNFDIMTPELMGLTPLTRNLEYNILVSLSSGSKAGSLLMLEMVVCCRV